MTATGICSDCGATFERDPDEEWKRRCLRCWIKSKNAKATAEDPLRTELAANLPTLVQLCHPDRHNNSLASTRVTQWLLELRHRLPQLERAA
jgi:hypothetical protein